MNLADKLSGWEKEVTADLNIHVAQHFFFFAYFMQPSFLMGIK